jgi:hypothetical protein
MLSSETQTVSALPALESRADLRGHPYRDLEADARELTVRLEMRALRCASASERKRLRVLAAAQAQITSCLSNVGAKHAAV